MLIQNDGKGHFQLTGLPWEHLRAVNVLTKEDAELLYGALCELNDYEKTGLTPEGVERLNEFVGSQLEITLRELGQERKKHRWIPVEERLPKVGQEIIMSFYNFSGLALGHYEEDSDGGGSFYVGDDDEPLVAHDLFVSAWMPQPEPYREDDE